MIQPPSRPFLAPQRPLLRSPIWCSQHATSPSILVPQPADTLFGNPPPPPPTSFSIIFVTIVIIIATPPCCPMPAPASPPSSAPPPRRRPSAARCVPRAPWLALRPLLPRLLRPHPHKGCFRQHCPPYFLSPGGGREERGEKERGGRTGFVALAVFLELADKVLVVALAALAVREVVLLQLGREALEELAFGRGGAVGERLCEQAPSIGTLREDRVGGFWGGVGLGGTGGGVAY